ncbi:FAD-binding oxidoreductase [Streptomyces nojiriensis]
MSDTAYDALAKAFRGPLVRPGDDGYEKDRRVWNGSVDRRPALISHCTGAADVIAAVRCAGPSGPAAGLPLAVRSGGHSFPGQSVCDDGIVIDLSLMKGIRVDPEARTVRAQAGVLLGELDHETQAFGLAVPAGIVTHTGLAGLTLGGGIGWLMRKYGLTIDQLLSVDLVTADGTLLKASADDNPDLFWGCGAAAATSASSRSSSSGSTRSGPSYWPARSPGTWRIRRACCASTASGSPTYRTT